MWIYYNIIFEYAKWVTFYLYSSSSNIPRVDHQILLALYIVANQQAVLKLYARPNILGTHVFLVLIPEITNHTKCKNKKTSTRGYISFATAFICLSSLAPYW